MSIGCVHRVALFILNISAILGFVLKQLSAYVEMACKVCNNTAIYLFFIGWACFKAKHDLEYCAVFSWTVLVYCLTSYKNCCKQFKVFNQSFSDVLKFVKHLRQEIAVVHKPVLFPDEDVLQTPIHLKRFDWKLWTACNNLYNLSNNSKAINSQKMPETSSMGVIVRNTFTKTTCFTIIFRSNQQLQMWKWFHRVRYMTCTISWVSKILFRVTLSGIKLVFLIKFTNGYPQN